MQRGLVSEDTNPNAFVARNPSATLQKKPRSLNLSWRRDLNPRPSDYKSDALPTELRQQSETKALAGAYIPLIPSRCPGQF